MTNNMNMIAPGHTAQIPSTDLRPSAWLRLAEYGDWPHPQGLQRLTRTSAEQMVRYFKSIRGRLARKFGGLPVFIGHPDDESFAGQSGHDDTRAYAWIVALEARPDGLYALPKWSPAGKDLLRNAFYKFVSPRWAMKPLGNGTYEPVQLISVGLTNHPNIPGDTIANESARRDEPEIWYPGGDPKPETAFANERGERIQLLLDNAVLSGQIAPNERTTWQAGLEADFDHQLAELTSRQPTLKTVAFANDLGKRSSLPTGTDFLTLVNERAERTGEPFATAWSHLKHERPDLFQQFNTF